MTHDHKVTYTREETIAAVAANWRRRHGSEHKRTFDITEFVETTLRAHLKRKTLKFELYDRDFKQDDPAYVEFDPAEPIVNLYVDRRIWSEAKAGKVTPASSSRTRSDT